MRFGTLAICYADRYQMQYEVEKPTVHIGGAYENDLVLYDPGIAPQHMQVLCDTSGYYLLDLGTSSGTKLLGQPIPPQTPVHLAPRQPFEVGEVTLFLVNDAPQPEDITATYGSLVVEGIEGKPETFAITRPTIYLGAGFANDVILHDEAVGPYHLRFEWTADTCTVVDLGTKTGSQLDGSRLQPGTPVLLAPTSLVTIGPLTLRWQPYVAPAEPAPSSNIGCLVGVGLLVVVVVMLAWSLWQAWGTPAMSLITFIAQERL